MEHKDCTDIDQQPARHPYLGRTSRGLTVKRYAAMLKQHVFSFRKAVRTSQNTEETLQEMRRQIGQEIALYRIAWDGGDDFVKVLSDHIKRQLQEVSPEPTRDDNAAMDLIRVMEDDLRHYALRLSYHNWYWIFSEDNETRLRDQYKEAELQATAKEKDGYYQKLFDLYVQRRADNIRTGNFQ